MDILDVQPDIHDYTTENISSAVNFPRKDLMSEDNPKLLKPEGELEEMLEENGVSEDETVIWPFGTGRETTNEFILLKRYFGFPEVENYENSFTERSYYIDDPAVTGKDPY